MHFTVEGELGRNTDEEDNKFYNKIKSLQEPLVAQNIPGMKMRGRDFGRTVHLLHSKFSVNPSSCKHSFVLNVQSLTLKKFFFKCSFPEYLQS